MGVREAQRYSCSVPFHGWFRGCENSSESEEKLYDELEPSGWMLSCFGNIISTSVRVC